MMGFGFISVDTHPRESRIVRTTVDGVDVTTRCYAANDIEGYADCYKLNAEGKKYVIEKDGEQTAARERLHGVVVIDFPNGLD